MPTDNNLLTATGQSMYSIVMTTALSRLLVKDYEGSWDAFCAIYRIMDPECKKECKNIYDETITSLTKIGAAQTNIYFSAYQTKLEKTEYLSLKLWDILEAFSTSLYNKGYTVFVSNRPQTRASNPKDLEIMLAKAKYGNGEHSE